MVCQKHHEEWAQRTFGHAQLGDRRRVQRLIAMAARVSERPAGIVTQVFDNDAEREGAFRLLESDAVSADALRKAAFAATSRTCHGSRRLYVAVDGSSLTLKDRMFRREIGRVGTLRPSRGLQVMSALAIDDRGTALGLLDQRWWARDHEPLRRKGNDKKCFAHRYMEKETRHWVDVLTDCSDRLEANATGTTAWYQLDRGADCWPVIDLALRRDLLITVRATHNRRLLGPAGEHLHLLSEVRRQPVLGRYELMVPRRSLPPRPAKIALRSCRVTIYPRVGSKRRQAFAINVVLAEEAGTPRADRIRWVLLTTHPVAKLADAVAVVKGYTFRWRIEDFHRAWKRGLCNVEKSQLRRRNAIIKWATLLALVAARALRLAHLRRSARREPAALEFTKREIDACYILSKCERDRRKHVLLGEFLDLVANLGGFANKYSGKHAGPTVMGRGLQSVMAFARGLKNIDEM